jgi:hypothetical protein
MPSIGLRARLAMPVLNFLEGISNIAVPVVSDPVPAVVGTGAIGKQILRVWVNAHYLPAISGRNFSEIGIPLPTGALMKSNKSAFL